MNFNDKVNLKKANLRRWFKEKWVDISKKDESGKHPPCGRSDADEKSGYPKCRPSKRISKATPETTKSMSKSEKKKAVAQKRRAESQPREGKKPHMTSHNKKAQISSSKSIVDVPIKCTPGFGCKRYFTKEEQAEINQAKAKIMSALYPTSGDPISSGLSSPYWAGMGTGVLGALLGGGIGSGVGALGAFKGDTNIGLSSALGALLGAGAGALYGYSKKNKKNKEIINLMQDLPVGADLGDVEIFSDPALRQQLARDFQRRLIKTGIL
jgi:hypothetical protein